MRVRGSRREKGAALITVLLMVSVLSAIAVTMLDDMRFAIRRQANAETGAQADWYLLGAEGLAREMLAKTWQASPGRNRLSDPWVRSELRFPIEGGIIAGQIHDASNCFNVNSLVEQSGRAQYRRREAGLAAYERLLGALGFDASEREILVDALADWIDSDSDASGRGAEDYYYAGLKPSYRAANTLIVDLSELRAVRGYEAVALNRIKPYLCAHPDSDVSPLNINTLRETDVPLLMMALGAEVTAQIAHDLIAARPDDGYGGVQSFLGQRLLESVAVEPGAANWLALSTRYFKLRAEVRYHEAYRRLASLFWVSAVGEVTLVSRQWGAAA